MTLTTNEIFDRDYVLIGRIGRGGYAQVWKASHTVTGGTVVAIKILSPEGGLSGPAIEQFQREYTQTRYLHHQNLLRADHYAVFNQSPYIVMPYCEGGSLEDALTKNGIFDEEKLAKILTDTAKGLAYLHQHNMIHNDIKPGNILISGNDDDDYLLSDFGISTRTRQTVQRESIGKAQMLANQTEEITGMAIAYAAPELFSENPISTPKSDVFSLGVSIYELATGQLPWQGMGGMLLRQGAAIPKLPEAFSERFNDIVRACLNPEPSLRPTAQDLEKWTDYYVQNNHWPAIKMKDEPTPQPVPKNLLLLLLAATVSLVGILAATNYFFSTKNYTPIPIASNQQLITADSLLKYTNYEAAIVAYKGAIVETNKEAINKKTEGLQHLVAGITNYKTGYYKDALADFQKASDNNIADGHYYLGELLNNGWGVKSDTVRGMKLTQKAIENGSNIAHWRMGYWNQNKNKDLSKQHFNSFLAHANKYKEPVTDPMVLLLYGQFYNYGWVVKIDKNKAKQYFERAAKLHCTQGMVNLGYALEDEGKAKVAIEQFKQAAELGDSLGQVNYLRLVKLTYLK